MDYTSGGEHAVPNRRPGFFFVCLRAWRESPTGSRRVVDHRCQVPSLTALRHWRRRGGFVSLAKVAKPASQTLRETLHSSDNPDHLGIGNGSLQMSQPAAVWSVPVGLSWCGSLGANRLQALRNRTAKPTLAESGGREPIRVHRGRVAAWLDEWSWSPH